MKQVPPPLEGGDGPKQGAVTRHGWLPAASRRFALIALVASVTACSQDTASIAAPPVPRLTRALLTESALQALSSDGKFVLPDPPAGVLSGTDATGAAIAYLHTYGPLALREYVKQSGVVFTISDLSPCGTLFAGSSYQYEQISDQRVQRLVGPHWVVSACTPSGIPVVSVSLSALAVELGSRSPRDGLFDPTGGDFYDFGIPPRFAHGAPVSPESAAVLAVAATGARVAGVPELFQPAIGQVPLMSRWRVPLDRSISLRNPRSAVASTHTAAYVGYADGESRVTLLVPDTGLPPSRPTSIQTPEGPRVPLVVRPGLFLRFDNALAGRALP